MILVRASTSTLLSTIRIGVRPVRSWYLVIKAVSVFHSVYYVYFVGERAYILGLLAPILLWQSKAVNS